MTVLVAANCLVVGINAEPEVNFHHKNDNLVGVVLQSATINNGHYNHHDDVNDPNELEVQVAGHP